MGLKMSIYLPHDVRDLGKGKSKSVCLFYAETRRLIVLERDYHSSIIGSSSVVNFCVL
jgi:hypothetical protein